MKKLLILILLFASTAYAVPESKVSGPDGIFGGGGVTEGSDVGFANLTAHRIKAEHGIFTNLTAMNVHLGASAQYLRVEPGTFKILVRGLIYEGNAAHLDFRTQTNYSFRYASLTGRTSAGDVFSITSPVANSTGDVNYFVARPTYSQSGTAGYNTIFINQTTVSEGSGSKSLIKANNDNITKYRLDSEGTSYNAGGQFTAFRNLSSAAETLTSADYFIKCLANDNEVVMTMPPVNASYSQTLMFKYTDTGSTNKCKLDGNGAEQVEGFDVYSGLDTYKEGIIVKSDGSAWWITGGL